MSLCPVMQTELAIIGGQSHDAVKIDDMSPFLGNISLRMQHQYRSHNFRHDPLRDYVKYGQLRSVAFVELFNLETYKSVALKTLNHARMECTFCNEYSKEMIVFGGHDKLPYEGRGVGADCDANEEDNPGNIMEIYDFHKNIWIDLPWKTKEIYSRYPCIWIIGSKCIFVASISFIPSHKSAAWLNCEWDGFERM